jgi:hypothetical protein
MLSEADQLLLTPILTRFHNCELKRLRMLHGRRRVNSKQTIYNPFPDTLDITSDFLWIVLCCFQRLLASNSIDLYS